MAINREIELYLSGARTTGLLLYGHKGMPLKEEGINIAASLLSTDKQKLEIHPDFLLLEKEAKEKSLGVDSLKELFSKVALKPAIGDIMVILICNIDIMTEQAQNKLLKTLEDNENVRIIATANDPDKVLATIKSRVRQINFYPLLHGEFQKWCEEHSYEYSEELYIITHGCPGIIEEYLDVVTLFKKISITYRKKNPAEIFSLLHLLKEKDTESFYNVYPELVPNLWEYLGFLVKGDLISCTVFKESSLYEPTFLQKAIMITSNQMAACKQSSYQKDSFFFGIVNFVEALKGEIYV